jgi:uncharacterized protein
MSDGQAPVAGIALLLWQADAGEPAKLATPFAMAAAAAAMETPVEIYFAASSVRLLVPGVAETLRAAPQAPKTILDWLRMAHGHGARLYACSDAIAAQGLAGTTLIAECSGHGGAVQFMARAADSGWRTLVF